MVNFLQLILGILVVVFAFVATIAESWAKWVLVIVGILVVLVSLFERSKPAR